MFRYKGLSAPLVCFGFSHTMVSAVATDAFDLNTAPDISQLLCLLFQFHYILMLGVLDQREM